MRLALPRLTGCAAVVAVTLTLPVGAWAQFRTPAANGQLAAAATTQAVANAAAVRGAAAVAYNPYYSGYGPYAGADPYGGYLNGAANVITSQGQFMVSQQQALLTKEQVQQAKIDTHRKQMDEYYYEQARRPTLEQEREKTRQQELARSQNNPPVTEIWSGFALNSLLTDIQRMESSQGFRGPSVPLEPQLVARINVTTGKGSTSVGVFKTGGKLQWPFVLQDPRFEKDRETIDKLAAQAVKQATYESVDFDTVTQLDRGVRRLRQDLKDAVNDIEPNDYISGLRYMNQLTDSLNVLKQPDASNYFSGKVAARGNSVGELVSNMTKDGLKFAAVTIGNEQYYTALHQAMVTYDLGLKGFASR